MRDVARDSAAGMAEEGQAATAVCPHNLPELPHLSEEIQSQCPTSQFGTLFVGCVSASGLKKKRFYRDNRALCRVEMVSKTQTRDSPGGKKPARRGRVFETPVAVGQDPEWKQAFHYEFACAEAAKEVQDYMLQVQIKDRGRLFGTKTHLGYAYVDFDRFSDFSDTSVKAVREYNLEGNRAAGADERTTSAKGKVKVALKWCAFGDRQCLQDAAEGEGLSVAGADFSDCHDGCHNALVERLGPIYSHARGLMEAAVNAGKLEKEFDDIEDEFEEKAEELEAWLRENPIGEHWKHWQRPVLPPCFAGEEDPPCPEEEPLTPEEEFALLWQGQERAREHNEAMHREFKEREEQAKAAFEKGKRAMDTIGAELVDGARGACGGLVVPFIADAGDKITKMPEGKFKIEKAEEAVEQLGAVWKSVLAFTDCLLEKWKHGDLLPNREVEALDGECFRAMAVEHEVILRCGRARPEAARRSQGPPPHDMEAWRPAATS
eukprot:CAMPEP_0179252364 /NCGR_PEP_ID=MMETSP0797-20121207/22179_1 /TAXON_ID=47934 /ORGANISM="Dinophysis acuminata, Strain DAEP01" /LENGTH=490 /DNA_ID=CAMNT_0020960197 /DNA_START=57 /DNA_END=1530 /DNA_ORIENTATION=+